MIIFLPPDIIVKELTADSSDFSVSASSVTFQPNIDSKSIAITAIDDDVVESDESFTLTLDDPENDDDVNLIDPHQLTVIIQNADGKHDT